MMIYFVDYGMIEGNSTQEASKAEILGKKQSKLVSTRNLHT